MCPRRGTTTDDFINHPPIIILLTSYAIRMGGWGGGSFLVCRGFSSFCLDQSNNGENNIDMQSLIACSQFTINLSVHRRLFFGYLSCSAQ